MASKQLFVGAFAALFTFSGVSLAQDSGLYVRGDVGYSASRNVEYANRNNATGALDAGHKLKDSDQAGLFGAGLGYRFTRSFRADFTATERGSYDFSDTDSVQAGWDTRPTYKNDIKSTALMLTAYFDLPKMGVVTPYASAGIGMSRNRVSSTKFSGIATPATPVIGSFGSETNNEFAWSLGVGASVDLSRNAALEFGYRYVDLGDVKTGDGGLTAPAIAPVSGFKGDKLRANELSVGVRYHF